MADISRTILLAGCVALTGCGACLGDEGQLNPCEEMTGGNVLKAISKLPTAGQTVEVMPTTGFIPAGTDMQVILDRPYDAKNGLAYRALVKRGSPELAPGANVAPEKPNPADTDNTRGERDWNGAGEPPALLVASSIAVRQIEPNDPRVTARRVANTATVATLRVPSASGSLWEAGTIYLLGCKEGQAMPEFIASFTAPMSSRGVAIVITAALVLVAYLLIATAAYAVDRINKSSTAPPTLQAPGQPAPPARAPAPAPADRSWWRYLDPIELCADVNGKASVSKLQILFFSIIVFGLLSYIVMRTGVLSDLSPSILLLLGISAVGAAASKATEVSRSRLDFDNWAWLIRKGWLPPGGLCAVSQARWRDLVTPDGEFSVYNFQMLIFSLVVGGALLTTGLNDLASFSVPDTLLGVLGLSQAVYVSGKLVAPPSFKELNDAVSRLRKLEADFVEAAAITLDPDVTAPQPPMPPADLQAAKRRAGNVVGGKDRTTYKKYKEEAANTRIMFKSIFSREVTDLQLEPSFV